MLHVWEGAYARASDARSATPVAEAYIDLHRNAGQFAFNCSLLAKAIAASFANRETVIDVEPIAFTPEFTEQPSTVSQ